MSRARESHWLFALSLLVGLLLTLVALPEDWRPLRPFWLGLLVIYWILEAPGRIGLGGAFLLGLVQDVLIGTLAGETAFRLVAIAFIMLRFRPRLRFFPIWQQALAVVAILLNDRVLVFMLRSFTGEFAIDWRYFLAPLVGGLLWPWLFLLFDDLRRRGRPRDG